MEPHEYPVPKLADLVRKIVEIEGPIHTAEVARRITSAFGKSRTGIRIVEATNAAVVVALRLHANLRMDGSFLMTAAQAERPPVRDRSAETGSLLKAEFLAPVEIAAAALLIRKESGDISEADLVRGVARLLGFQRVGPDLLAAISSAIPS